MEEHSTKYEILNRLESRGISYDITEHPAAFTIEDIHTMHLPYSEDICKNLFLRDAKGKRHFLVVMRGEKRADLAALQTQLGSSKLSFASEERLFSFLKLQKGAVTPLGILNDTQHTVEVVLDRDLSESPRLGVHPCVNTATVWISYADLYRLIEENGNEIHRVTL